MQPVCYLISLSRLIARAVWPPPLPLFRQGLFGLQIGGLDGIVELRLFSADLGGELDRCRAVQFDAQGGQLRNSGGVFRRGDDVLCELVDNRLGSCAGARNPFQLCSDMSG